MVVAGGVLAAQTQATAAKFRLAQTYEQAGDYQRAAGLYRELLEQDPSNTVFADGYQRMLVQLKQYDDAIRMIQRRLLLAPEDINLHATLAGVYQRAGREQEARKEWDAMIARGPTNATMYRIVASSMIEYRLLDQAAEIYRRGRAACNDPSLFTLELAQLRIAMMDYKGASRELVDWLLRNPTQIGFVQGRLSGFVAKPDGRRAAIAVVEETLRNRRDVQLYELLGWLYREGKDFETALGLARTVDDLTRAQGGALLEFADRVFKEKALDVAARAYQEAIHARLPPRRLPVALYGYANTLKEIALRGDTLHMPVGPARTSDPGRAAPFEDVLEAYRRIIREYPRTEYSAKAYYQIGILQLSRIFDLDGALASFGHVMEEAGGVGVIRYDVALKIARLYTAKGDTVRAAQQCETVVHSSGATPDQQDEAQFRLAELAFFEGRFDEAVARLDSITVNMKADYANDAIELQSFLLENASASAALKRFGQAEFLARQRKNTEAIALLQDIVKQFPGSLLVDDALMRTAELQEAAGFSQEALGTYHRLLTEFKETSVALDRAHFNMAEIYQFDVRDTKQAIGEYEKLLAEYPNSVFGSLARKRIRLLRGESL